MEQNWSGFGEYGDKRLDICGSFFPFICFLICDFDRYYITALALDREDFRLVSLNLINYRLNLKLVVIPS